MKKIIFALVFVLFTLVYSVEAADCFFALSCAASENLIMKFDPNIDTNVHFALSTDATYTKLLCCHNSVLDLGPTYSLINLSAATNAHAKVPLSPDSGYGVAITVDRPIYYRGDFNPCDATDDCVLKLSNYSNAHGEECTESNYPITVCAGSAATVSLVNMSCGNVTIDSLEFDPACVDPGNPSSEGNCLGLDDGCVYNDTTTTVCNPFGATRANADGKTIICSNNNTWCPSGMVYNDITRECALTINSCDMGHTSPDVPSLTCDLMPNAFFAPRKDFCFCSFK